MLRASEDSFLFDREANLLLEIISQLNKKNRVSPVTPATDGVYVEVDSGERERTPFQEDLYLFPERGTMRLSQEAGMCLLLRWGHWHPLQG